MTTLPGTLVGYKYTGPTPVTVFSVLIDGVPHLIEVKGILKRDEG